MRTFYTASDIEDLAASGVKQLEMGPGVMLTGAAKERAEELGVVLVTPGTAPAGKAAASASKATAPAAGPQGGPAQSGTAKSAALPARPRGCQHGPLAAKASPAAAKAGPSQAPAVAAAAVSGGPMVEQLVEAVSALKKSGR